MDNDQEPGVSILVVSSLVAGWFLGWLLWQLL